MNTYFNIQKPVKSRHLLKKIYFLKKSKPKYLNLSYKIYRPLISFSRLNVLKFCEFWSLPVYPDGTNFNIKLIRNRLRLELIPYLKWFFNKNLFNKISQIQNILDFENQYFQLLLQKIFLTFFQTNSFICKDSKNKNLFQFIRLKIKMNYYLQFDKPNTLISPKNNQRKKKYNLIVFNRIRKSSKIRKIKNFMPRTFKIPVFFNKSFSKTYINAYFSVKSFNDWFWNLSSFAEQSNISRSHKNCNFIFFPKFLQYRLLYHFYYSLSKKISFNEINCFFEKLNIKKK